MNIHTHAEISQGERKVLRIGYIKQVWRDGISATEIAHALTRQFGERMTKSAICGLYERNREALVDCPLVARATRKTDEEKLAARNERRRQARALARVKAGTVVRIKAPKAPAEKTVRGPRIQPDDYDKTGLMKRLFELDRNECRWPISGEKADILFCAHPAAGSYCDHHRLRSVGPGTISERRAPDSLRRYAQ